MTASWCRSVVGPGVLRDSIRPMAPGVSDHDRAHRECSLPHICLPVVLAHGSFDLAKNGIDHAVQEVLFVGEVVVERHMGLSRQHVHRWLARYRDQGIDGVEPRSRRPHSNPQRTASGWRRGSSRCVRSSPAKVWITDRRGSAGTWATSIWKRRRHRRSGGSCWRLHWSLPNRRNGPRAPIGGSRPISPTSVGNPTSPTGDSPMARGGDHQLARRPPPLPSRRRRPAPDHR